MQNRAIRGCLIVAVAFVVASALAKQPKPRPAEKQEPRASQSDNPPENPIAKTLPSLDAFPVTHEEPATEKAQESDREYPEWLKNLFSDLKITDILLTLFTGVLAIYSYRLWRSTEKLWEAGERQIAVAKKSADAAMKSAIFAESTLVGTEAPFLFAIVGFSVPGIGTRIEGNVRYTLRNFGRSPAIVREIYHACIASTGVPDPVPFPPLQTPILKVEIIAARDSGEAHQLNEIKSLRENGNSEPIFVVGQARYADVFGNQYLTGFCYFLNELANAFYITGGVAHNYRRKLSDDEAREAEARDTLRSIPRKES